MALFRRAVPRRAAAGAFVGFLFSLLILLRGELLTATGWFLLSVTLLWGRPFAYYTYLTWAILWVVWRGVLTFRQEIPVWMGLLDVLVPLLSIALLSSSGYIEALEEPEPVSP